MYLRMFRCYATRVQAQLLPYGTVLYKHLTTDRPPFPHFPFFPSIPHHLVDPSYFADNSDLLAVTVVYRDGARHRRFLVVGVYQIVLVEPDATRLGWGVSTFVGYLQDLEASHKIH